MLCYKWMLHCLNGIGFVVLSEISQAIAVKLARGGS